jgi:hypothetical protein
MLIIDIGMIDLFASWALLELGFLLALFKLMISQARDLDYLVAVLTSCEELAIIR